VAEVRFYQLGRRPLDQVLATMLERANARGQRALVQAGSKERVEALADHLWTYNDRSFLPHGTAKDGHAAQQPIWLTDAAENPNGAAVLFLLDGVARQDLDAFQLTAIVFDGSGAEQLSAARALWKELKEGSLPLTYWEEDANGRWTKKAEANAPAQEE